MNIVMPMAGRGSRFREIGIETPKPLIDVRGRPMYTWAMDSLPLGLANRLIFVCQNEHLRDHGLRADIESRYGGNHELVFVGLDGVTEGQACTVLAAREYLDSDEPLVIYNADTYCRTDLASELAHLPASVAGVLSVFRAPGDKWSFARTDAQGRVVETAEKRRISDWATTGLYHFSSSREFVRAAQAMIDANERENREFYVAPVYNRLIRAGAEVRLSEAQEVWVLGTPEDLDHFERNYPRAGAVQ